MLGRINLGALVAGVVSAACLGVTSVVSASSAAVVSVQTNPVSQQRPIVRGVRRDAADHEKFSTAAGETLELVLADGTSVTLAPASSVVLDHYSYDRQARLGALTLSVVSGSARVIGGVLNNTAAITLNVPGAHAVMDNGIAAIDVRPGGSELALLLGKTLKVNSTGKDRQVVLSAAGQSLHISPDGALDAPTALSTQRAQALAVTFNPGLTSGVVPQFEAEATGGPAPALVALTADVAGSAQQAQLVLPEVAVPNPTLSICGTGCSLGGGALTTLPTGSGSITIGSTPNQDLNHCPPCPPFDLGVQFIYGTGTLAGSSGGDTTLNGFSAFNYTGSSGAPENVTNITFAAHSSTASFTELNFGGTPPVSESGQNGALALQLGSYYYFDGPYAGSSYVGLGPGAGTFNYLLPGTLSTGACSCDSDLLFGDPGAIALSSYVFSAGITAATNPSSGENDLTAGDADYFLAFQSTGAAETIHPTSTTFFPEAFFFATGSVAGLAANAENKNGSVDYFDVTPGLPGADNPATRDFLPGDADLPQPQQLGLAVNDNGMVMINPPGQNGAYVPSRMMDSDFALSASGASAGCANAGAGVQCSTISLTLGAMQYSGSAAQMSAYTIGSTQLSSTEGNVEFSSPLESTAVGGGNPALCGGQTCTAENTSGRAGYIVLQNYTDNCPSGSSACADLPGGTMTSGSNSTSYALLRVGAATNTTSYLPSASAPLGFGGGYIAGLVQGATNSAGQAALAAMTSSSLDITPDAANATVSGTATVSVNGASENLLIGTPGGSGTDLGSAYLSNNQFGAFAATVPTGSSTAQTPTAALVSAGQLDSGAGGQSASQWSGQALPASPSYLQWGFLFGDVSVPSSSGSQWGAQLVPWISGNPQPAGKALPTGTVQYNGIVAGNVLYQSNLYAVTGTYTNSWNFGSGKGSGDLIVDSALYPIRTSLSSGSVTFTGAVLAPIAAGSNSCTTSASCSAALTTANSLPTSRAAVGSMNGTFVQGDGGVSCTNYCGAMGSLQIVDNSNAVHSGPYTLVGVFGGSVGTPK